MSDDDDAARALFGPTVPAAHARILMVGFELLTPHQQGALVDDLRAAQHQLIGACVAAALDEDLIEEVCPNTADEFLNPQTIAFRLRPRRHAGD